MSSVFIFALPATTHAQPVGLVCLAPTSASACPSPPVTVSASVGGQLDVAVLVQGSDAFSAFDITLVSNHTTIKPADVITSGSVLSGGSVVVKCRGGALVTGSHCSSTDNADTLHIVMTGPPGFITGSPVTGLLFTAVYNVTGPATTQISFQTGCSPSSVSGTTDCVLFANGSLSFPLETVQGASYTQAPTPTFAIGTSSGGNTIGISKGQTGNVTLTLTSINGFAGTISLSLITTPTTKHPPSSSVNQNSVSLSSGGSYTVLLTASADSNTTKGGYDVTVTGTSGALTGSVQITLIVGFG